MKRVKLSDVVPSRFARLTPANAENIERIRADLVTGSKMILNDPHAFRVGATWELLAGHDRVAAARLAGWTEVQIRDFSGTSTVHNDDAILGHFCRENLLRKDVSKASVAGEWLRKHPDWSDAKVADESGCTAPYVGMVRAELGISDPKVLSGSREGRDGKVREVKPRAPRTGTSDPKARTTPAKPKSDPDASAAALVAGMPIFGGERSEHTPAEKRAADEQARAEEARERKPIMPPAVEHVEAPTIAPAAVVEEESSEPAEPSTEAVVVEVVEVEAVSVPAASVIREALSWMATVAAPKVTKDDHRAAALLLDDATIASAREWHKFLGTFLLNSEIARSAAAKAEAA